MKDFFTTLLALLIVGIFIKLIVFIFNKLLFTDFIVDTLSKYYLRLKNLISSFGRLLKLALKSPFIALIGLAKAIKLLLLRCFYNIRYQSSNLADFSKDQYRSHKEKLEEINQTKLDKSSIPNSERIEYLNNLYNESLLRIRISERKITAPYFSDGERYSFEIELQRLSFQIQSIKDSIERIKEKALTHQEVKNQEKQLTEIQESSLSIPELLTSIENRILTIIIEENHE